MSETKETQNGKTAYEQLEKRDQDIFNEAWDDVTNSTGFLDAMNKKMQELLEEYEEKEKVGQ